MACIRMHMCTYICTFTCICIFLELGAFPSWILQLQTKPSLRFFFSNWRVCLSVEEVFLPVKSFVLGGASFSGWKVFFVRPYWNSVRRAILHRMSLMLLAKAKHRKAKQRKANRSKAMQRKAKHSKATQSNTNQSKSKQCNTKQRNTTRSNAAQSKAKQSKGQHSQATIIFRVLPFVSLKQVRFSVCTGR